MGLLFDCCSKSQKSADLIYIAAVTLKSRKVFQFDCENYITANVLYVPIVIYWDSSVSVVTKLRTESTGNRGSIPASGRNFFLLRNSLAKREPTHTPQI